MGDWQQRGRKKGATGSAQGAKPGKGKPPKNKLKYSKEGRAQMKAAKEDAQARGQVGATSSNGIPVYIKPTFGGAKGKGKGRASHDEDGGNAKKTRTGFRIGPKPAPGVYTGKADKIKASLIHNAKVKKRYASMLKREGLADPDAAGSALNDASDEDMGDDDDGQEGTRDEDSMMTEAASPKKKGKRPKRDPDQMQEDIDSPKSILSKRKSADLDRDADEQDEEDERQSAGGEVDMQTAAVPSSSRSQPFVHPDRRSGGKQFNNKAKEEAVVPPKKRQRLSEADIEQKREERQGRKKAWTKKGRSGQPDMGSRMGVLLGKIERNVGAK